MSKNYTREKFQELEISRKARVVLDLIKNIESAQMHSSHRNEQLTLLKNYFQWADFFHSSNPFLKNLSRLEFNIHPQMSMRALLDLAVPLERFLELSVKDENILQVTSKDNFNIERVTFPFYLVLDHLRSSFNVGSIFRSAECFGVEHIYLVGYTPTPEDHGVLKTALGATEHVPWSTHLKMDEVIKQLHNKKVKMVAMETAEKAIKLNSFTTKPPLALFVGNERFGLKQEVLAQMDECVSIPMLGVKNSLNVANSVSVASFELNRQWM